MGQAAWIISMNEAKAVSNRMSIPEIAERLAIGERAVYAMLEQRLLPGIRLGRRWLVTRRAYETWERTCGMPVGMARSTEVHAVEC
jgi:excisionase family DNA binding protein